jgi:hypothetical protein
VAILPVVSVALGEVLHVQPEVPEVVEDTLARAPVVQALQGPTAEISDQDSSAQAVPAVEEAIFASLALQWERTVTPVELAV